jgi:hypothetical protein
MFEYIGELSSMAVFRLAKRISDDDIDRLFQDPPDGETQIALISRAIQRSTDPYRRLIMSFAKLRVIGSVRGIDAARAYLAFVEGEYAEQIAQTTFRRVQNVVRAMRFYCEGGGNAAAEREALAISIGRRGSDHRRTDVVS